MMGGKITKIHFDNKVFFTFLSIFLIGATILSINFFKKENCDVVDFKIIAKTKTTSDLIEFKSIGAKDYKWEWDFGDKSDKKFVSNTLHQYKKDGTYKVTLKVNNSCIISKEVIIRKEVLKEKITKNLVPKITIPKEIKQGEMVTFECVSDFAKKWEWRFGESRRVDAITSKANYKFKKAGFHKISLITNDDLKHVFIKEIIVLPGRTRSSTPRPKPRVDKTDDVLVSVIPDKPDVEERPNVPLSEVPKEKPKVAKINFSRRDAIAMLNDYASGKIDYADISSNFCSSNVKVIGKKNKNSNLKALLKEVRGKKLDVKNITLLKNKSTGCVKLISIDLEIKQGLFWREY